MDDLGTIGKHRDFTQNNGDFMGFCSLIVEMAQLGFAFNSNFMSHWDLQGRYCIYIYIELYFPWDYRLGGHHLQNLMSSDFYIQLIFE